MAHPLVVLSDTKSITDVSVVTIDYGSGLPLLCRSGIWVGLQTLYTETIVSYEHEPEELYVGSKELVGTLCSADALLRHVGSGSSSTEDTTREGAGR